jgi:hypothetical protein
MIDRRLTRLGWGLVAFAGLYFGLHTITALY